MSHGLRALIWALGQAMGPDFDIGLKDAWKAVIVNVSTAMNAGAAEVAPAKCRPAIAKSPREKSVADPEQTAVTRKRLPGLYCVELLPAVREFKAA